jgi:hypothetical protein
MTSISMKTVLDVNCILGLTDVVQQVGKSLHEIRDEIARWRIILEVPHQEYSLHR